MNKFKNFWREVNQGSKKFGESIAAIINSILLTFVYFIGVGLTSIFAKMVGKKFLDTKIDRNRKSYWDDLDLHNQKLEEYYKQF